MRNHEHAKTARPANRFQQAFRNSRGQRNGHPRMESKALQTRRLGRKLIPGEFADFLDRNIDQIKDARTLGAFVEHFQGVVGYTAGRLKK